MRAHHFLFCTLLVGAAVLPCAQSAAQPAGSTKAGADAKTGAEDPQRLYQQGVEAYKRGDVRGAEPLFLKAWALAKTYDVAANLGVVELELKKYREAAELLAFSARNATPSVKPAQRDSTRQALEEAKKHLLTVRVSVNVDGAALSVDGVAVAAELRGPELFLTPGKHVIEATAEKHEPAKASVDGSEGSSVEVTLALKEKVEVPVVPTATATATVTPPPAPSLVPAYVALGAGVAGLVVGAVAGAITLGKADQLRTACGDVKACSSDLRRDYDDALTISRVSTAGFVVAGIGVAVGVPLLLLQRRKGPSVSSVVVGPSFVGVKGAF